jgi:hypothetical protein
MQYLKRLSQTLLAVGGLSFSLFTWADGTDSGTTVTNAVTMSFTVGAVSQNASTDISFLVDRKLRLDVGTPNGNWVSAVAGQAGATSSSVQFEITNNSNDDNVNVVIALVDQLATLVTGYDPVGSTAIVPTGLTVWEDTDANGLLDGAEVSLGVATGVYALAGTFNEDDIRTISVRIDVDGASVADLYQTYTLVAAVGTGVGTGVILNDDSSNESPNVPDVAAVTNDLNAVEIVFADDGSAFPEDEAYDFVGLAPFGGPDDLSDGQSANAAGFRTIGVLGIAKYAEVLWDPISGNQYTGAGNGLTGNEPKSIPGAVIMYLIGVNNQSSLAATAVAISDDVPGGQVGDPLFLGNSAAVAGIELPDSVTITIDASPVVFDLDNTNIGVDTQVYVRACSIVAADPVGAPIAFGGDPAEVNAVSLGASCDASSSGYVVYFATVDNTAT